MESRTWEYIVGRTPGHEDGEFKERYESTKVISDGDSLWFLEDWRSKEMQ